MRDLRPRDPCVRGDSARWTHSKEREREREERNSFRPLAESGPHSHDEVRLVVSAAEASAASEASVEWPALGAFVTHLGNIVAGGRQKGTKANPNRNPKREPNVRSRSVCRLLLLSFVSPNSSSWSPSSPSSSPPASASGFFEFPDLSEYDDVGRSWRGRGARVALPGKKRRGVCWSRRGPCFFSREIGGGAFFWRGRVFFSQGVVVSLEPCALGAESKRFNVRWFLESDPAASRERSLRAVGCFSEPRRTEEDGELAFSRVDFSRCENAQTISGGTREPPQLVELGRKARARRRETYIREIQKDTLRVRAFQTVPLSLSLSLSFSLS